MLSENEVSVGDHNDIWGVLPLLQLLKEEEEEFLVGWKILGICMDALEREIIKEGDDHLRPGNSTE